MLFVDVFHFDMLPVQDQQAATGCLRNASKKIGFARRHRYSYQIETNDWG